MRRGAVSLSGGHGADGRVALDNRGNDLLRIGVGAILDRSRAAGDSVGVSLKDRAGGHARWQGRSSANSHGAIGERG